jgi:hypothetical protein
MPSKETCKEPKVDRSFEYSDVHHFDLTLTEEMQLVDQKGEEEEIISVLRQLNSEDRMYVIKRLLNMRDKIAETIDDMLAL